MISLTTFVNGINPFYDPDFAPKIIETARATLKGMIKENPLGLSLPERIIKLLQIEHRLTPPEILKELGGNRSYISKTLIRMHDKDILKSSPKTKVTYYSLKDPHAHT